MEEVRFRWLGVAGIELTVEGEILAIDPFFSRIPWWRVWIDPIHGDRALVAEHLPHCDVVLVTHSHYDHVLDVPDVVRNSGALVLGSRNTCRVLEGAEIPSLRYQEVHVGDDMGLGRFAVTVLPGSHITVAGRPLLTGDLPNWPVSAFGAQDYRMDACYSYLITAGGLRMLDWASTSVEGAERADVLWVGAPAPEAHYRELAQVVQPKVIIPIHWDDFFRPLSRPLRPFFRPPQPRWPPLGRLDIAELQRMLERAAPGARVLVPEIFAEYDLATLL